MTLTTHVSEDLKRLARLAANITDAHTSAIFIPSAPLRGVTHSGPPGLEKNAVPSGAASGALSVGALGRARSSRDDTSGNCIEGTSLTSFLGQTLPTGHLLGKGSGASPTIELKRVVDESGRAAAPRSIELAAVQTLSTHTNSDVRIQVGYGLLGWVAEHGRPIHISPFDLDSTTLGLYNESESIRCLVAVPIPIHVQSHLGDNSKSQPTFGVLMCDSKKAFSFSKVQVKHLEELAPIIGRALASSVRLSETSDGDGSWGTFCARAQRLADAIGLSAVEMLRIRLVNLAQLEQAHGISGLVQRVDQFSRLVQQALPPHFPVTKLPSAEILVAVDNMMSAFFQNKIRTLAGRLNENGNTFEIEMVAYPCRQVKGKLFDIDAVLRQTGPQQSVLTVKTNQGVVSGGRRA